MGPLGPGGLVGPPQEVEEVPVNGPLVAGDPGAVGILGIGGRRDKHGEEGEGNGDSEDGGHDSVSLSAPLKMQSPCQVIT